MERTIVFTSTRIIAVTTLLVAVVLCAFQTSSASLPQSLVYDTEEVIVETSEDSLGSFVRMDPKLGLALNLAEVSRLKKLVESQQSDQPWIPVEARKAKTKDQFLRMIAEYHVKDLFKNSALSQWRVAQIVAKAEDTLKNGFTYELEEEDEEKEEAASKEESSEVSTVKQSTLAPKADKKKEESWSFKPKSLGFLFSPEESKARIYMKAKQYTAELSRSMNKNETTLQLIVPEVLNGQITFLLSSNTEEVGKLGYRFQW